MSLHQQYHCHTECMQSPQMQSKIHCCKFRMVLQHLSQRRLHPPHTAYRPSGQMQHTRLYHNPYKEWRDHCQRLPHPPHSHHTISMPGLHIDQ